MERTMAVLLLRQKLEMERIAAALGARWGLDDGAFQPVEEGSDADPVLYELYQNERGFGTTLNLYYDETRAPGGEVELGQYLAQQLQTDVLVDGAAVGASGPFAWLLLKADGSRWLAQEKPQNGDGVEIDITNLQPFR